MILGQLLLKETCVYAMRYTIVVDRLFLKQLIVLGAEHVPFLQGLDGCEAVAACLLVFAGQAEAGCKAHGNAVLMIE